MGLIGSSATFAPLMADTALWWNRRRGIAVAICASGNYIAGALWPPIVQHGIETLGWRQTYMLMGVVCGLGMLALALRMRQRAPMVSLAPAGAATAAPVDRSRPFGLPPAHAQWLLCVAGVACCVAVASLTIASVNFLPMGLGSCGMAHCAILATLQSGGAQKAAPHRFSPPMPRML